MQQLQNHFNLSVYPSHSIGSSNNQKVKSSGKLSARNLQVLSNIEGVYQTGCGSLSHSTGRWLCSAFGDRTVDLEQNIFAYPHPNPNHLSENQFC
jgi:hypothetical protein